MTYDPRLPGNADRVELDVVRGQLDRWYARRAAAGFWQKMLLLAVLVGVAYLIPGDSNPVAEFALALLIVGCYVFGAGQIEGRARAQFDRATPYPLAVHGQGDRTARLDVRR